MDIFQLETSSEDTAHILRLLKEAGFEGRVTRIFGNAETEEINDRIVGDAVGGRLMDIVPCGLALLTTDGLVKGANAEARRLLRIGREGVEGAQTEFPHLGILDAGAASFAHSSSPVSLCLATGAPQGPVTVGRHDGQGRVTWTSIRALPVFDSQTGNVSSVIVTLLDETDKVRAEQEISKTQALLAQVEESSPHGSWQLDLVTNRVTASKQFCKMFGIPSEQFAGYVEDFIELFAPDDRAAIRQHLDRGRLEPESFRCQARGTDQDGNVRRFVVQASPFFDWLKQPICLLGRCQDISTPTEGEGLPDSKSCEARATELDVESVRQEERTTIAREIHDELWQLLTVLKMNLKMQEENLQHGGRIVRRQLLQEFESLSSIMDLAIQRVKRIATELRAPIPDNVALVKALKRCAAEFQKYTGISCVVKCAPDEFSLEPQCATALLKILQEALTNVARHSHARRAIIVLEHALRAIMLKVSDDGVGIPEEDIGNPKSLGLRGMRERAALLGGSVSVESLGTEGTRVTLSLPLSGFLPKGQFSKASSS